MWRKSYPLHLMYVCILPCKFISVKFWQKIVWFHIIVTKNSWIKSEIITAFCTFLPLVAIRSSVCVHTAGEVDSFNAHCSVIITSATCQIWRKFLNDFYSYSKKNFWLTFCGHGVVTDNPMGTRHGLITLRKFQFSYNAEANCQSLLQLHYAEPDNRPPEIVHLSLPQ